MHFFNKQTAVRLLNEWGINGVPFLFFTDYHAQCWYASPLTQMSERIKYDMPLARNFSRQKHTSLSSGGSIVAPPFGEYEQAFELVQNEILAGNSFLTNLTWRILCKNTSEQVDDFHKIRSTFNLMVEGEFSVFSPEAFISVQGDSISTFPMKGTISSYLPDAEQQLLSSAKEAAEHATIVDLMRNDLSQVAEQVKVKRYRYCEDLGNGVLQTSSEVQGQLFPHLQGRLGDILAPLLPVGSITGAPKIKTCQIIRRAEPCERGFYTGVMGIFDGKMLQTAVMIRFLQYAADGKVYFHGGGGITAQSKVEDEYNELIIKAKSILR